MSKDSSLMRQAHFLGTKIRNLRKRNGLTMEDLSSRCVKLDPEAAPSVSYLSMIERGKRTPSMEMLGIIAAVFQKDVNWFLDNVPEAQAVEPVKGNRGGIQGMPLEPSFLFSNEILQIAIPEMLSQTGTTGRQFAQLLIRAHQEHHQNHFPDLERAAEEVGGKRLPLSVDDIQDIAKRQGLELRWFSGVPDEVKHELGEGGAGMVSSFFEPPHTIHLNKSLKSQPKRLKYDLAAHIGHAVLHNNDGVRSVMVVGRRQGNAVMDEARLNADSSMLNVQDILHAWRDFECSFFAGALLCPKIPFRQLLDRQGYEVGVNKLVDVTESVVMRRMTAVSPYPHWHYFDAYTPGKLKAVYRGNGIPLPWGNMRPAADPCHQWAVFRMINEPDKQSSSQISILRAGDGPRIYACESVRVKDLARNAHVLCAGVDLNPAIEAQGGDAGAIAEELQQVCVGKGGSSEIPAAIQSELMSVARILNINWIERGIGRPARMICPRGSVCPRTPACGNC